MRLRVVRAAEERLRLRGEKARHGPAALPGQCLGRLHVDGVDVGAFLPVDLDIDESLVDVRRDLVVLKRLVRHDVAPVAGSVPDRQQNWSVQPLGFGECLRAPGPPVHWIILVLQEIGAS